jgi:hypothetical protein
LGAGAVLAPATLCDCAGALGEGEDSGVLGASTEGFGEEATAGGDGATLGVSGPGAPALPRCSDTDADGAVACSTVAPAAVEGATLAGDEVAGAAAL